MLASSLIALLTCWLTAASTVACPITTTKPVRSLVPSPPAATRINIWRGGHVFCCLPAAVDSFSSEPVPLLTTASRPGDPDAFSPLPCCSYKILRFFPQLSALGHTVMICFLLYCLFLLGCLQFPEIMGCILVLLSSHFLPFSSVACWKAFVLSTVSNLFLQDATKKRVILGNCLWKGNQVSFELFCFPLLGIWNLQGQNSCAIFLTGAAMINKKGMALRKHVMQRRKCSGSLVRHRLD